MALVLMCGLSFSGKSTLATQLAAELGAELLSLDGINEERGLHGGQGIPLEEWANTNRIAHERAGALLASDRHVIIDDTGSPRFIREEWRATATEAAAPFVLVWVQVTPELQRHRVLANRDQQSRADVTDAVLTEHSAAFEPPSGEDPLIVDAARTTDPATVTAIVEEISARIVRQPVPRRTVGLGSADSTRENTTMRPLILSGGPAVGKTTCGRALAGARDRAAYIDGDDIRQLVVAGAATLWSGPEGQAQHELAVRNTAALARNLLADGFAVTASDVVTAETLPVYREHLPDCFIVHLAITLDAARARAATRPVYITDDEFELLHRITATPPAVDLVIDVTDMTVEQQIERVHDAWAEAEHGFR